MLINLSAARISQASGSIRLEIQAINKVSCRKTKIAMGGQVRRMNRLEKRMGEEEAGTRRVLYLDGWVERALSPQQS